MVLGARDPEDDEQAGPRLEVRRIRDRPAVPQGGRQQDRRRLGGAPAGHAQVDLRDPAVQEGCCGVRGPDARVDGRGPDQQPGHHETPRPARRAVRRGPAVPGRGQPVHTAVLGGDRRSQLDRLRAEELSGHRVASGLAVMGSSR